MESSTAYKQLELDEESKQYLEYFMENLFQGIPQVAMYIDDILITAPIEEAHLETLRRVLELVKEAGLTLKIIKCSFMAPS